MKDKHVVNRQCAYLLVSVMIPWPINVCACRHRYTQQGYETPVMSFAVTRAMHPPMCQIPSCRLSLTWCCTVKENLEQIDPSKYSEQSQLTCSNESSVWFGFYVAFSLNRSYLKIPNNLSPSFGRHICRSALLSFSLPCSLLSFTPPTSVIHFQTMHTQMDLSTFTKAGESAPSTSF